MQLFTIGLVQLNLDGTVRTDSQGEAIPTFDQSVVEGFRTCGLAGTGRAPTARQRTALSALPPGRLPTSRCPCRRLRISTTAARRNCCPTRGGEAQDPGGQTPERDLEDGLDNIFNHPNVGPFISAPADSKVS